MADDMDRVLDELFASECPHELIDHDEIPCRACTRAAIAAAEERGRRAGIEDQADLLLACEEALIWCSAADAFRPDGIAALGWQRVVLPVLERIRIARKSLAPRDSGKEEL